MNLSMIPEGWLNPSLVLPEVDAASVAELVRNIAEAIGTTARTEPARIEAACLQAIQQGGFSIGRGVALPHIEMESLAATLVCLVTTRTPLPISTLDGRPPDIFFFILSKPDPHGHLLLLAHLARLAQSRTLLDGLRRAQTPDEVIALVRAAEMRHSLMQAPTASTASTASTALATSTGPTTPASEGLTRTPTATPPAADALIVIAMSGEKAVDALLIDLVDQDFADACVLEAQSLREAAAREVPLFAGFRDLFGDPGGHRVLLIETTAARTDAVVAAVKRIAEEYQASDARVSIMPLLLRWALPSTPADRKSTGGH